MSLFWGRRCVHDFFRLPTIRECNRAFLFAIATLGLGMSAAACKGLTYLFWRIRPNASALISISTARRKILCSSLLPLHCSWEHLLGLLARWFPTLADTAANFAARFLSQGFHNCTEAIQRALET